MDIQKLIENLKAELEWISRTYPGERVRIQLWNDQAQAIVDELENRVRPNVICEEA